MTSMMHRLICLLSFVPFVAVGCSVAPTLEDGVYPVAERGHPGNPVELEQVPMEGYEPGTIWVTTQPLLVLRSVSRHEFQYDEQGECMAIALENTEALRAYSRDHVGSRLALVIGGKSISDHKIRVPLETATVEITSCTKGGADHVAKHLKRVLPPR